MNAQRYPEEFRIEAVKQILEHGHSVADVSRRLGVSTHNCHDNAVAESFFQLLKRERIRKHVYATRKEARSDVFSYIEMFYNPIRRHSSADGLSPVEYERRNSVRLATI